MDTINKSERKRKIRNYVLIGLVLITYITYGVFDYFKDVEVTKELAKTNNRLEGELLSNANCNHTVDSLNIINEQLSTYESLTMAMVHRDEATKELAYDVGDIVYMKSDSSRVVIEDILIGGGKYNYFIKYKVLFKDDTRKEVTPEMVY